MEWFEVRMHIIILGEFLCRENSDGRKFWHAVDKTEAFFCMKLGRIAYSQSYYQNKILHKHMEGTNLICALTLLRSIIFAEAASKFHSDLTDQCAAHYRLVSMLVICMLRLLDSHKDVVINLSSNPSCWAFCFRLTFITSTPCSSCNIIMTTSLLLF